MRKLYEKCNKKYFGLFTSGTHVRSFLGFYGEMKKKYDIKPLDGIIFFFLKKIKPF